MKYRIINVLFLLSGAFRVGAQSVSLDYSAVYSKEEVGLEFVKLTSDADGVCMPKVRRRSSNTRISWWTNRVIDISANDSTLAFLAVKDQTTNVFIKPIYGDGDVRLLTHRQTVLDLRFSLDGQHLVYSELSENGSNELYLTNASNAYVAQQLTANANDYSPVFTNEGDRVFFSRQDKGNHVNIWSMDMGNRLLSLYSNGMNPELIAGESAFYCVRTGNSGYLEIWKVDYETGQEIPIVTDSRMSFSTPSLSPDGKWLVLVGGTILNYDKGRYYCNTDIYVCKSDGSDLRQLTNFYSDDLSPVWSRDGKYIYFVSQRGSDAGIANVWRMTFKP